MKVVGSPGKVFLTKVEGRLNGEDYINILENALIPTTHLLTITSGWIFQQDNATCHTSRELFNDEQITVMDWPAQSTNLNPIENLWDQIKTMVEEQNPTSAKLRITSMGILNICNL